MLRAHQEIAVSKAATHVGKVLLDNLLLDEVVVPAGGRIAQVMEEGCAGPEVSPPMCGT